MRATTALMLLPAVGAVSLGTLLAPYRVIADTVFVLIMMGGVWVRRFGPRGFSVGMAAVMSYFFSQFLNTQISGLPWLVLSRRLSASAPRCSCAASCFVEKPQNTAGSPGAGVSRPRPRPQLRRGRAARRR